MVLPNELKLILPPDLLSEITAAEIHAPEELRFRIGQPISVVTAKETIRLNGQAVCPRHLDHLLERACGSSMHMSAESLREGYLQTASGCRIGFCGRLLEEGNVLREITSASIRIPHAALGCAKHVADQMLREGVLNTLILSPPGCGKTTLLRDLIRLLSESGMRICVADERGELAGICGRTFGFDLGPNTDVMTGGRKAESAMRLLRAMNPQLIAFDEITAPEDLDMIRQTAGCGVRLLATAHAASREAMERRPLYRQLLESGFFCQAIWIRMRAGKRDYETEKLC